MSQALPKSEIHDPIGETTAPTLVARHLGATLRLVYEAGFDKQPIPDGQVDLLLRLRHKERALRRTD